ncbi:maleylpyruvate isomerase family mycothiol-dependent enzyme [Mycobacterium sp. LTG2003]
MAVTDAAQAVRRYQETKDRIGALVSESDALWDTAVAACPGWSVRDVLAHMTAVAEDWVSGRLAGAPTDEQTAAQVARFKAFDAAGILTAWNDAAAELARRADTDGLKPPLGDVVVHEHDIRAALGRPGARDSAAARDVSDQLLAMLRTPVPLVVTVEDAEYRSGPDAGSELRLDTTRFEALRWRTGRRSRAQLAAMAWSGDPTPVLDSLYLFGPANTDLIE